MSALLEVKDIKVHFGGVKAVDGVDLDLKSGALYGLVGPNGSGKSTLLGALSRMTNLTEGTLCFSGEEYQKYSASRTARLGIGRTFQAVRLLPELSVLENVMLGGDSRSYGCGILANWLIPWRNKNCERLCREGAMEAIDRLELTGMEKRTAGTLPYGSQRRVEIARMLNAKPTVVALRRAHGRHEPRGTRRNRTCHARSAGGRYDADPGGARHAHDHRSV